MHDKVKIIVPVGSLGAGVRVDEIARAIGLGAHVIATDAGSTDSGAAYLALGLSKNSREAVKRDLAILMKAQAEASIPLLIGSCGQAGGDDGVNWTRDIALEIAGELGLAPKIALLRCEQDKSAISDLNDAGKVRPLAPLGPLANEVIDQCDHIVAVMGAEPYIAALKAGADIVLGGRTTDTAVIAAFALMKGAPKGPAWHAAKIAECGAQCTAHPTKGAGVLLTIGEDSFEVEPLSIENRCDPPSVSAHMLYENSDPFRLIEPGGILDVSAARYTQKGDRSVEVTNSVWIDQRYTLKLEGAGRGRFQTIMLIGIQDPDVLTNIGAFHDNMLKALYARVRATIGAEAGDFHVSLRLYGWNAVSGDVPPAETPPPREIGVLFVATAATQEMATRIAKTCNPYFFHFPLTLDKELPSYGFAFSPADIERGPVFEFKLNHVVEIDDPLALVRTEWLELGAKGAR